MRNVKISRKVRQTSAGQPSVYILEEFFAVFHKFYEDADHEPAAIIERLDGSIEGVSAYHMTFITPHSEY